MQENVTVSAADIARLTGVGRAAVSNWRKRHTDFPAPIGGTPASPEFDLGQVERWLRSQGRLPELSQVDVLWRRLAASGDNAAATLAAVGACLLTRRRGERTARRQADRQIAGLIPDIGALADDLGPEAAFDELWQRYSVPAPGRPWATPDDLSDLMAGLAGVASGSVLDPACGTGATLRAAARAGCTSAYGQELDEPLSRLAWIWLALRDVSGEVSPGDSLRGDEFAGQTFDAVVCHPPFGVTNWGQEELGYDPRWEYGAPPRTEPELAWVQHALAHLRPGGHAVLLMPPAAASRRAGRRIRAELLRRGALRAVVALPPGMAAPHGVPLHLWVLRRPAADAPAPARALLIDAGEGDPAELYPRVLATWRSFTSTPDGEAEETGFARAVPVIELLDEAVDLTPARRQPGVSGEANGKHLVRTTDRLAVVVGELSGLMPRVTPSPDGGAPALTLSVAELARTGALQLLGPVRPVVGADDGAPAAREGLRVFTLQDVVSGREASGRCDDRLGQEIPLAVGDVVVPIIARQLIARVVTAEAVMLGRNLYLLRPNPAALDPWFLAGQLRTSANEKQASSLSGTLRFDIRRAQVRRLPMDEQRAYGDAFRRLVAFEAALREAAVLGEEMVKLTADGLARGSLRLEGASR